MALWTARKKRKTPQRTARTWTQDFTLNTRAGLRQNKLTNKPNRNKRKKKKRSCVLCGAEEPHSCASLQSAAHVVADFVYEFFNLCGSVHRLFSGYYGRSSPDHAVDRRCQSGRPLGTRRHGTAASTWTRRDRRRREETRHWWHSPSNNDHNRSESGRGAGKVGWFICFINFAPPPPKKKAETVITELWPG